MSEKYLLYKQLTPLSTLEVLTRVAKKNHGLPRTGLGLVFEGAESITLCLTYDGKAETGKLYRLLRAEYGNEPYSTPLRPRNLRTLSQALPMLALTTSTLITQPTNPFGQEYLLVGHNMDDAEFERAAKLLRYVNIRTQVARTELDGKPIALFYLKVNGKGAESTLQSELSQYPLLRAYKSKTDDILFMPLGQQVDQRHLDALAELARTAPEVWGGKTIQRSPNLLLAVETRQDNSGNSVVQVWYLAPLEFVTPEWNQIQVQVYLLQNSEREAKQLRQRIRDGSPPWGYPLELHRMERQSPAQAAYDVARVRRRINELQALAAYLESVQVERPRLYRFTQKQLPALANVLANLPPKALADGKLKYGFESNDHNAEGLHYLFLEPGIEPFARPDPTPLWTHLDMCEMSFWLDPYWAKEYYDSLPDVARKNPEYLVFVPEWTALYPAFHDWDAKLIGARTADFMRESVEQWTRASVPGSSTAQRRAALKNFQSPAKPFYVFDGRADPTVQISVLDSARFVPLVQRLDWLNQNLYLHVELGNEEVIKQLADLEKRRELALYFERRTQSAEEAFRTHAARTELAIAETTQQMVNQVSSGLDNITAKTTDAIKLIRELNARMQELYKKYGDLKGTPDEVEKGFQDTRAFLAKLQSTLQALETQTDDKIRQAERERDVASRKVDDIVTMLSRDIEAMRDRLNRLW